MYGYIYKITNPIGQIYIGQTVNATRREKRYKALDCKSQKKIYESILYHGWENHKFEIIYRFEKDKIDINKSEIFFVAYYKSFYYENRNYGLNMTKGGRDLSHQTIPEVKEKMLKVPEKRKHSEETKRKISLANKGQVPWCKGKKFTREHIDKIRASRKTNGKKRSYTPEQRKAISEQRKGSIFTKEHRQNISLSAKNRKSQGANKKVILYNPDFTLYGTFISVKFALDHFGSSYNTEKVRNAINKQKLLYNKYWFYENSNSRAA